MSSKAILILEDDHDSRVTLRQVFEDLDFRVYTVANGLDAIAILKRIPKPDLIVCDLMMPLMNGEEFLKFKNSMPEFADIKVIVVSAFEDRLSKIKDFPTLRKPFDLGDISRMASYLKNSGSTDQ